MTKIKAVIFDMDGVLLDSEPLHDRVLDMVLGKFGYGTTSEFRYKYVGASSMDLWEGAKEIWDIDATVEELIDIQWKTICEELPKSGIGASKGLYTLLDYLKANNIKIAIASSSRGDFVNAVIDHLKIRDYIDSITQGFEVENGKPAPDIYLLAAQKLGVLPSESAAVEDSTNGTKSAKTAGMLTIGYDNPTSQGQFLDAADVIVKCLDEAIEIIEKA